MAKQGQHHNDHHDEDVSPGPNNPRKSVTITAGTPKRRATFAAQARAHEDTDKQAQEAHNAWHPDTHVENRTPDGRIPGRRRRSGSDSNASSGTRGH